MSEGWEDESYQEILGRAKERIASLFPEWTDYNPQDPGITILELFAWMQEGQRFQIAQTTAGRPEKYLKLLGVTPRPSRPGRGLVTVRGEGPWWAAEGACCALGDVPFRIQESQMAVGRMFRRMASLGPEGEEAYEGAWLEDGMGIQIYPFGQKPKPGNRLVVELCRELEPDVPYGLFLRFSHEGKERGHVEPGGWFSPPMDIRMEYGRISRDEGWEAFYPARVIRDETCGFWQDGMVRFAVGEAGASGGSFRSGGRPALRFLLTRYEALTPQQIVRMSLSVVKVAQQERVERTVRWEAYGEPCQTYDLEDGCVLEEDFSLTVEAAGGERQAWERVQDFDGSGGRDCHYCLERGVIRFGDGDNGRMPKGTVRVDGYTRTLGARGNVKADTSGRAGDGREIVNEWEIPGGRDAESMEEAFDRYRSRVAERICRAVTMEDYERLAEGMPGLGIWACRALREDPESPEVTLVVLPLPGEKRGRLNRFYERNILRYLDGRRLLGTRLKLCSPEYIGLSVTCRILAHVEYRDAAARTEQEISAWVGERPIGGALLYGELYGRLTGLPWVRRVQALWMDGGSRTSRNERGDLQIPAFGQVYIKRMDCAVIG